MAIPKMQFHADPSWLNAGIVFVAAVVVWTAGTRLRMNAGAVAVRTKLSHALPGPILCWPR